MIAAGADGPGGTSTMDAATEGAASSSPAQENGAAKAHLSVSCGGALNALGASPDGNSLCVVGREVLKVYRVQEGDTAFKEKLNLRVGKVNLNFSSVDVKWHPMEQHAGTIATAATNGAVVIWNIEHVGSQKQERVINDHSRTVNRIYWHPEHAFTLLSGSQDGSMKLWDIRDPSNCKVTFEGRSESVRDVVFSPHYANYFAAGFDNGNVLIWDIRKSNLCERKITAHQGPVFCLDWHPNDKSLIATGGRDRFIQIWDLNGGLKPVHTIQHISSVSRVKWRPNHQWHISTSALVDKNIHIWNIQRPYIPLAAFIGHTDVVADFQWHRGSPDRLISVGKDSFLLQQSTKDALRPFEHARTVALSWTPTGDLAMHSEKIDRKDPQVSVVPEQDGVPPSIFSFNPPPYFKEGSTGAIGKCTSGTVSFFTGISDKTPAEFEGPGFDALVWSYLADHYWLTKPGTSFGEICQHNAESAREVKQHNIAQTWMMLKTLLPNESLKVQMNSSFPNLKKALGTNTPSPIVSRASSTQSSPVSSFKSSYLADSLEMLSGDFVMSPENDLENLDPMDDLLSADVNLLRALPSATDAIEGLAPPAPPPPSRAKAPLAESDKKGMERKFSTLFSTELKWDVNAIVEEMLCFYAENGDVQSAVMMSLVLGDRISIPKLRMKQWLLSYIDLLHHLRLWDSATEIIRQCKDPSVRIMNRKSTTLHTSCPHCTKPLHGLGWFCEQCHKTTSSCSICHEQVKGIYVWCQGCGHGGHLDHINRWFENSKHCPTGCGHTCIYRPASNRIKRSSSVSSMDSVESFA